MKATDFRKKSDEELTKELNSLLKARFSLKMQLATQQSTKTSEPKKIKKDIARIKTVLREKQKGNISGK